MATELKSHPIALQIILGVLLFAASLATGWHANKLYVQGKHYSAIEAAGLSLMIMGGSFDPINYIWLCLPFTRNQVSIPSRFALVGWLIGGVGFIPFLIGLIGRHMTA